MTEESFKIERDTSKVLSIIDDYKISAMRTGSSHRWQCKMPRYVVPIVSASRHGLADGTLGHPEGLQRLLDQNEACHPILVP